MECRHTAYFSCSNFECRPLGNLLKPLQLRLEQIEEKIESLEYRKKEIEALMTDENFFKSKDHIELTEEHKTSSLELESAFSDWSKISDEDKFLFNPIVPVAQKVQSKHR